MSAAPVLQVEDLAVTYRVRSRHGRRDVRAVDGVSFTVGSGEILALVGESGCGKTTVAQAVMRLVDLERGRVDLAGVDLTELNGTALRQRRREFQMIFQDPFETLDPRRTVGDTVLDGLVVHGVGRDDAERRRMVLDALDRCGLRPAAQVAERYPHQLSGGQRQRVSIAAAMVLEPRLVVADEPVSMLDVSVRAGILRLMLDLREELGTSFLFITHDLSLAWMFADRIAVLYLGRIVEEGPAAAVIGQPRHPYTRALVSVVPVPEAGARRPRTVLTGETPNAAAVPDGCRFHPRCPRYRDLGEPEVCRVRDPVLLAVGERQQAACHFAAEQPDDVRTQPDPEPIPRSTS